MRQTNGTRDLLGTAYVSSAEIERFKERYATLGLVSRSFGINHRTARPVIDPEWLGARDYLRADVDAQLPQLLQVSDEKFFQGQKSGRRLKLGLSMPKRLKRRDLGNLLVPSGEFDATLVWLKTRQDMENQ